MRTANPALNERTFRDLSAPGSGSMSLQGTVNKTIFLLMIALLTAAYTWHQFSMGNLRLVQILMMVGVFGGFVVALVTIFAKHLSRPRP